MSHMVICKICNQKFDRDKIQAVKCGARRYAHYTCYPEGELVPLGPQEDPDLKKLKDYIAKIYNNKANYPLINKQIKKFKEKGYSYSGMLKSLIWFYEVKGNNVDNSNGGIGIIDYCYQDAYNYYYNLFIAQELNKNKTLLNQIKEIVIKPPKPQPLKKKFFDLGEEDEK